MAFKPQQQVKMHVPQGTCRFCYQGKIVSIILKVLIVTCLVILVRNYFYDPYEHIPRKCPTPKDILLDLEKLILTTNHVLNNLNLTHFICYGTLWSALRREELMPWDYNGEFCLLNKEVTKLPSKSIQKAFSAFGLHVTYLSRCGYYRIILPNKPVIVKLVLFSEISDKYGVLKMKVECQSWLGDTKTSHTFPKLLIDPPLPLVSLNGIALPAPHEGVEIQKYLYPDNWWFEVRPDECEGKDL